jgi:hypothetical protein
MEALANDSPGGRIYWSIARGPPIGQLTPCQHLFSSRDRLVDRQVLRDVAADGLAERALPGLEVGRDERFPVRAGDQLGLASAPLARSIRQLSL